MRIPGITIVQAGVVFSLLSGCMISERQTCEPSWCKGCCAVDGRCMGGAVPTACGTNGQVCDVCASKQVCATGICSLANGSGLGDAGGGGAMGGGAGGGGAAEDGGAVGGGAGGAAGGGAGGGSGAGGMSAGGGSGGGSGSGGGGGTGGGSGGGSGSGYCLARSDAGTPCTTECVHGFSCVGGRCQLNGGNGPVQITLRFPHAEDLDLHVREPLPDGGHCELYYGDKGPLPDSGTVSSCGAQGWLDLDSNAACSIDNINIENVIYDPSHPAPSGRYEVYVDYYQFCLTGASIDYEVEVRSNGGTRFYCGSFTPFQADEGGRGSGRPVTFFNIP